MATFSRAVAPDPSGPPETPAPRPRAVRMRATATTGLFVLAVFYTLYVARPFLLPVVLAVLLNFVLRPLVRGLRRLWIPRGPAAAIVLLALLGGFGTAVYRLAGPAAAWVDRAPQSFRTLEERLRPLKRPVEKVGRATDEVERLTGLPGAKKAPQVEVREASLRETVLSGFYGFLAGAVVTFILTFFLLASGDFFLHQAVAIVPRFEQKRRVVRIARQTERQVSTYLATVTMVNAGLGVATALLMHLAGMPNPVLWGVMAAILNFIPYLGSTVSLTVITLVSFLSFDGLGRALVAPALFLGLDFLEGNIVSPLVLGRRLTLNPVVIFLAVVFWWWVWGIAGAILAVPMLATFKLVCDHVDRLKPVGLFLARPERRRRWRAVRSEG